MRQCLISSAALIALLALARPLLRGRVPAGLSYGLWLLALVRLAIPAPLFTAPVSAAGAVAAAVPASLAPAAPAGTGPSPWTALWLAGSGAMALWFGGVNAQLALRLRRTRRRYDRPAPLPVFVADVPGPCLYGLFRPRVYLSPAAAADPETAAMAIAHERTHKRHGDHIWAAVRLACLIVYWFDPFVWLAASLSKRDGELFCDEATVRALGEERRFAYGRALLAQAAVRPRPADLLSGASTMSGGARRMRERLARLVRRPRYSRALVIAAAVGALCAAGFTFAGPAEEVPAAPATLSPAWTAPPEAEIAPSAEEAAVFSLVPTGLPAEVTPEPTLTPEPTAVPAPEQTAEPPMAVHVVTGENVPAVTAPPAYSPTPPLETRDAEPVITGPPAELPAGGGGPAHSAALEVMATGAPADPTPTPPSTVPDSPGPGTTLIFTDEDGTERVVQVTATPAPVETPQHEE